MAAQFSGPEDAFTYLAEEQKTAERLAARQQTVCNLARVCLGKKGAYIRGIGGYYGGTEGLYGSANYGILAIQGTEPVPVSEGANIALRHKGEERNHDIYLVVTDKKGPEYLKWDLVRKKAGILAVLSAAKIEIPSIEGIELSHIEAVELLVKKIASSLDPVELQAPDGQLPRVNPFLFGLNLKEGRIIDLRKQKKSAPKRRSAKTSASNLDEVVRLMGHHDGHH